MLAKTQVLTFHGIGVPAVPVSPEESHYFVPIETYQRTIERLPALEQKHGVKLEITFDDGNLSDYEVGLPALWRRAGQVVFSFWLHVSGQRAI